LLNQTRLNGPDQETIDQIVRLSIRYGIVTPYTSYLVTEDMPLGQAERERIAGEQYSQMQDAPEMASGQDAVEKARAGGEMAESLNAAEPSMEAAAGKVRVVGSRTFVLREGVWTDTAYDPDRMQTVKVPFLSDDYFALSSALPDLAAAFALGEQVIAVSGGNVYEVVGTDDPASPVDIPQPALPPDEPLVVKPDTSTEPLPVVQPETETGKTSSSFPCLGGLLPLILAGMAGMIVLKKR
jgi:Ca-activated chloride channel homolog